MGAAMTTHSVLIQDSYGEYYTGDSLGCVCRFVADHYWHKDRVPEPDVLEYHTVYFLMLSGF